jgi:pilus assembly protein CpaC
MNKSFLLKTLTASLFLSFTLLQVSAHAQEAAGAQTVHILVGKSVVINSEGRIKRILVSNPAVIDALATSPTQVVLEARAAGSSNLILWDESGQSRMLDVVVDIDVSGLRDAIERAYPNQGIQMQAQEGRLVISGTVPNKQVADDLVKMAGAYSSQVVNSLSMVPTHERQLMLGVKFAEVDRTKLFQFGVNLVNVGALNTIGTISTQSFGPPGSSGGGSNSIQGQPIKGLSTSISLPDLLNIFLFRPDINLATTIRALEQNNVLQILAEPNLLALSGRKASFLAGGEFPFPVVQGGANIGAVTIQFRPFGVRLDFVGVIDDNNVIHLQVAPEVSTLDFANSVTIAGFTVPAISTRRAETEIELKDGQSFGIAGLMDQRTTMQLSKIPGIGDIPILGQLFRSRTVNKSKSELLVLVTPHIVDPVMQGAPTPTLPKPVVPNLEIQKFDEKVPGHNKLGQPPPPPQTSPPSSH